MREEIQTKLSQIKNIDSGKPIADDIVENNKTYFGYEITQNYMESDFDKNYTYRVNIIGYVVRKENVTENSQQIIDEAVKDIVDKLKELNFKLNFEDISQSSGLIKTLITGFTEYNEINNGFIL